jgi:NAD(P)-dependent dehydrogenase (short-subunit alcohol dehydrogenase family)
VDLGLAGRRALVFGSTSGLGCATAESLVEEGARVAIVSRDLARAEATARAIGAEVAVAADITVDGEGAAAVARAAEALSGLDICVVNTGGGTPGPILATGGADDAAYRAMLRPALEIARAASPLVVASGAGRLVFLTARSVVEATPDLALSSVFRSGVHAAARSLALELAPRATVNVVITGQFDAPSLGRAEAAKAEREGRSVDEVRRDHVAAIPMGRVGAPRELADVVAFLCSARAGYVTGTAVRVDGGSVRGF